MHIRSVVIVLLPFLFGACASNQPLATGPTQTCDAFPVETVVREGVTITVARRHCVDASEPDADGFYEYYSEYDLYELTQGTDVLMARAYRDSDSGHLLSLSTEGARRFLQATDLDAPLAVEALARLRALGKTALQWFDGEAYVPIEDTP